MDKQWTEMEREKAGMRRADAFPDTNKHRKM